MGEEPDCSEKWSVSYMNVQNVSIVDILIWKLTIPDTFCEYPETQRCTSECWQVTQMWLSVNVQEVRNMHLFQGIPIIHLGVSAFTRFSTFTITHLQFNLLTYKTQRTEGFLNLISDITICFCTTAIKVKRFLSNNDCFSI